jgi:hypothetical protein
VWYLMRCLHQSGGYFPVISMYKDMTTKFEAQKQPQHAYVLAESLIALAEFEKAQYVIESLVSRGVAVPPYIFEKFPILILMRLRSTSEEDSTSFSKKAVAYAIRMISSVPVLSRATERNLNVLKNDSEPWIWKEMRLNLSELSNKPYAQQPAGIAWMNQFLDTSDTEMFPGFISREKEEHDNDSSDSSDSSSSAWRTNDYPNEIRYDDHRW